MDELAGRYVTVVLCPHCGAENADGSVFCSLCLASLGASDGQSDAQQVAYTQQQQQASYVSPGDYRALAQEMARNPQAGYRDSAYYHAAMEHPDAVSSLKTPAYANKRSKLDMAIMVAAYSFAAFAVIFAIEMIIRMWRFGAVFAGSEGGSDFGIITLFFLEALTVAIAGYAISAKAMHPGRGWLYGLSCTVCAIFIWLPLSFMIVLFLITGDVYVPLFSSQGILIYVFLCLPVGALGGWIAEKRLMG